MPTDRKILLEMMDRKRYSPKLIGLLLDKDSSYIATQLRKLEQRGYVQDPARNYELDEDARSQMYELTKLGVIVTYHISKYVRDSHTAFHQSSLYILSNQPDQDQFFPDLVALSDIDRSALYSLQGHDGMTIPSDFELEVANRNLSPRTTHEALYSLYYHKLATRHENMSVYKISDRGERAIDLIDDGITDPVDLSCKLRETYSKDELDWLDQFIK